MPQLEEATAASHGSIDSKYPESAPFDSPSVINGAASLEISTVDSSGSNDEESDPGQNTLVSSTSSSPPIDSSDTSVASFQAGATALRIRAAKSSADVSMLT
jgi:hypothetical protein